ncbi:MAG: hypothetical protein HRT40_00565 [Campylobacteraceae bacterium]|nr:hypothetical protein [Campylobacteraceae bacterium]
MTSKLMDLINEYEISLADITLHRDNEPIELKRSKVLADYDDNEKTHKDRAILKRYTELLSSPWIKLKIDGKRIYERIKVKRTYINDLKKHGRIYVGHWQSCKSYKRATITINDVETVEVDIANCSLRIVLQLSKIDASGDLYIIKDYPRALVKDTINMMFNIGDGVRSYAQGVERTVKALLDKYKDCERSYLKGLVLDCYEHYKVIADEWFFQGRGLDLHYLDSRVCMNVIEEFTKDNQVVLTVHDSYIVKKELEHKLRQSITKNYSLIIGREPILT